MIQDIDSVGEHRYAVAMSNIGNLWKEVKL